METEVPAHRACASCRNQKVRCIPDDSNPDTCQRCKRAGRTCVFTPLQRRKQRKRTDTRVAELEKQMQTMRAMLKQKESAMGSRNSSRQGREGEAQQQLPKGFWYKDSLPHGATLGQAGTTDVDGQSNITSAPETALAPKPSGDDAARIASAGKALWPARFPDKPMPPTSDPITSGMISMATARQLFQTYKTDLFPHYPLVHIPARITADQMREEKPALFLSVIAAASAKENSELSAALDKEVLQCYATRSLVQSQKSLELVQALLVSAVWYYPPQRFGQLKYYEYIHMAATMAMDIGIGSRHVPKRGRFRKADARSLDTAKQASIHPAEDVRNPDLSMASRSRDKSPDTASLEARRTFLSCYIICAGVSLSLRRPNMLRVSSYIRDCADHLEQSPDAISTDPNLVAWVRLIMVAEEISTSFSYDDPGGMASITELRTQMMLKDFEARLASWYNTHDAVLTGSLIIMYYTVRLYLFEIALHVDHAPEDFKAPYQMGELHPIQDAEEVPTQVLAESVAGCINSAHALLTTFLLMDVESLRALPVFSYVRISFAAFILAKLSLSAAHPRSRIARVLDKDSLKVQNYMDRAILHVRNIVGNRKSRVPSIFLALLFKLRQWCLNPTSLIEDSEQAVHASDSRHKHEEPGPSLLQSVTELDQNRITEHISSSSNSPQTVSPEASGGNTSSTSIGSTNHDASMLPPTGASTYEQSTQHLYGSTTTGTEAAQVFGQQPAPTFDTMQQDPTSIYNQPFDQMDVDGNDLFQFLGDMTSFPEGGLTGLDDWATMAPNELAAMGQMNLMNWQVPGSYQGSTTGRGAG